MKSRPSWGTGMALVYGLFAGSTIGLVAFAMAHPVDLVSADYYARSEAYDLQLAAMARTDALADPVAWRLDAGSRTLALSLPPSHRALAEGTVTLYRPSAAGADRTFPLVVGRDGVARVSLDEGFDDGLWRARARWRVSGEDFYREDVIRLP
jgi:hypothetical protein